MKLYRNISVLAAALLSLTACQETEDQEQHYTNHLFLQDETFTHDVLFPSDDPAQGADITVAIAKPEAQAVTATVAPAPEMLAVYKQAYYNESAVLLPAEHYSMPETQATINAGSIQSTPLHIDFLATADLDFNTIYVLPVSIKSVSGAPLLESARTTYYVFKGASLINVVCNLSNTRAYPDFNNEDTYKNLTENTIELLFKATSFPNQLNTLVGIEGKYLLRCGDAGVPANQLQIATSAGNLTSGDLQFETGQWYHVAVTFQAGDIHVYVNGKEKLAGHVNLASVNLSQKHNDESSGGNRCLWLGYSYSRDRFFDGAMSEVRIWNRALTPEEINATNHFYKADPASEGLIAYWKLNEGAGQTAKDYSPYGHDLTIEAAPKWEPVALPEK